MCSPAIHDDPHPHCEVDTASDFFQKCVLRTESPQLLHKSLLTVNVVRRTWISLYRQMLEPSDLRRAPSTCTTVAVQRPSFVRSRQLAPLLKSVSCVLATYNPSGMLCSVLTDEGQSQVEPKSPSQKLFPSATNWSNIPAARRWLVLRCQCRRMTKHSNTESARLGGHHCATGHCARAATNSVQVKFADNAQPFSRPHALVTANHKKRHTFALELTNESSTHAVATCAPKLFSAEAMNPANPKKKNIELLWFVASQSKLLNCVGLVHALNLSRGDGWHVMSPKSFFYPMEKQPSDAQQMLLAAAPYRLFPGITHFPNQFCMFQLLSATRGTLQHCHPSCFASR